MRGWEDLPREAHGCQQEVEVAPCCGWLPGAWVASAARASTSKSRSNVLLGCPNCPSRARATWPAHLGDAQPHPGGMRHAPEEMARSAAAAAAA